MEGVAGGPSEALSRPTSAVSHIRYNNCAHGSISTDVLWAHPKFKRLLTRLTSARMNLIYLSAMIQNLDQA